MAVIMVPNIIFAIRKKEGFENIYHNKALETAEEIGRYGCFVFMIFRVPSLTFGWWSDEAFAIYLVVDAILILLYCLIWALCFRKESLFRSLSLSIIPSIVFIFQRNNDEVHSSYPFLPSLCSQPYHNISEECKGQMTREL